MVKHTMTFLNFSDKLEVVNWISDNIADIKDLDDCLTYKRLVWITDCMLPHTLQRKLLKLPYAAYDCKDL